jgi:hypothetical protein
MAQTQTKNELNKNLGLSELQLDADKIEAGNYPPSEIYEVSVAGNLQGTFWATDLKKYIEANEENCSEMQIRNFGDSEWVDIYSHAFFQRRKPQIITNTNISESDSSILVLKEGLKDGPYNLQEISDQISEQKLLVTDMISIDNGLTWNAIHKLEDFDRRNLKAPSNLPHGPRGEVFLHSNQEVEESLSSHDRENDEALADLAYIGNIKSAKPRQIVTSNENTESQAVPIIETTETTDDEAEMKWLILFIVCVVGLGTLYATWPDSKTKKIAKKTKVRNEVQAEVKAKTKILKAKPIKKANKIKISQPKVSKPLARNRKNISFKKSKAFRKAASKYKKKLSDKPIIVNENSDTDNYYDDGTDPVELDPVRRKLSKETLDPEFVDEDSPEGFANDLEEGEESELFDEEVEF